MFENHMKQIRIGVGVAILVISAIVIALIATEPYALTADGEKVTTPWAVKAGSQEIAVVQTEEQGKEVVEGLKKSYYEGKEEPKDLKMTPAVTVERKDLDRGDKTITLSSSEDAVNDIVKANKSDDPVVVVSYSKQVKQTKKIAYKTVYKKTSKLKKGNKEVKRKGKVGKKAIVATVTYANGKAVKTVVVDQKVTSKAVNRVVLKGTKRLTASSSSSSSNGGTVSRSASRTGQSVANFACQFVGNPYVWGGSSLTNGADCSGFVMAVYARYGISLPHSASAIGGYGTSVPYSQAAPGDVIIYPGHCGIYIGGGQIVHASSPEVGIIIGSATYTSPVTIRRML